MVELVSPGGNLEKIRTAFRFGADAVYCGFGSFHLRSRNTTLTEKELVKAIDIAHSHGGKLYVTLNAFVFDRDFASLVGIINFLTAHKPDAVVVSDLGVVKLVSDLSDIPIHVSTQANITNSKAIGVLQDFNVKRVILARELSVEDIEELKSNVRGIEVEVFVHGAMCMAYSGRCLISEFLTGRSANKGDCAQSCRWKFGLIEEKRPGEVMGIEEHPEGVFLFNSNDLCAIPVLDRLIDAGVDAFKIEGRMKSSYYVAVTTAVYREAIDALVGNGRYQADLYMAELSKVSHRKYSTGFFVGTPGQNVFTSRYHSECTFVGTVEERNSNGILIRVRNQIYPGDYEFFTPHLNVLPLKIDWLYTQDGERKGVGNTNELLYISSDFEVDRLDILRRCR